MKKKLCNEKNSNALSSSVRIHFLIQHFSLHDGICNVILAQKTALEQMGYICSIYSVTYDKGLESYRIDVSSLLCKEDDLIIDHVGYYNDYKLILASQPCRKILYYHNITPSCFFSDSNMRNEIEKAYRQVKDTSFIYDFISGVSKYNLDCLKQLGIDREGDVLPPPISFNYLKSEKVFRCKKDINFLFVGRIVEHKKIEEIIDCFLYYNSKYNQQSFLTFVGRISSLDYFKRIKEKVANLKCKNLIKFTGLVSDKELQMYYKNADVFLCMSEHEGFCLPIIEAMYNGVIVFAYDCAAVGETVGKGGILFKDKSSENVAKLINNTLNDEEEASRIIKNGFMRAEDFSEKKFKNNLSILIDKWMHSEIIKQNLKPYLRKELQKKLAENPYSSIYDIPINENVNLQNIVKRFVKKCIRAPLKWLINPILRRQLEFNNTIIRLLDSTEKE